MGGKNKIRAFSKFASGAEVSAPRQSSLQVVVLGASDGADADAVLKGCVLEGCRVLGPLVTRDNCRLTVRCAELSKGLVKDTYKNFEAEFARLGITGNNIQLLGTWNTSTFRKETVAWFGELGAKVLVTDILDLDSVPESVIFDFIPALQVAAAESWLQHFDDNRGLAVTAITSVWSLCGLQALVGKQNAPKPQGHWQVIDTLISGLASREVDVSASLRAAADAAAVQASTFEARQQRDAEAAARVPDEAAARVPDTLESFIQRHNVPTVIEQVAWWNQPNNLEHWALSRRTRLGELIAHALLRVQSAGSIEGQWRRESPSIQHATNEAQRARGSDDAEWQSQMEALQARAERWKAWESDGDLHMQDVAWQLWGSCVAGQRDACLPASDALELVARWEVISAGSRAYRAARPSCCRPGPNSGDRLVAFALGPRATQRLRDLPAEDRPWPIRGEAFVEGEPSQQRAWFLFTEQAKCSLECASEVDEEVVVRCHTRGGLWDELEDELNALTQVVDQHRRSHSGFAKATNWTGYLNLAADTIGFFSIYDAETNSDWLSAYGGMLPRRIKVEYGSGKVFTADKEQKTKMEANVLEAAVGELMASGREDCQALAELIGGLCTICALLPPRNVPPSNRHMLYNYEAYVCQVLCHQFDLFELDRWIDERIALLPEGPFDDAGLPGGEDIERRDAEGSTANGGTPPPKWGRPDLFKLLPDGAWWCKLCRKQVKDGHLTGQAHVKNLSWSEETIKQWLQDSVDDAPPLGRPDIYKKLPDGAWWCRLCSKQATKEHVASPKHLKYLAYPEDTIQEYIRDK